MEPLVTLNDAEREYIVRVHAGELSPDLLFPNDDIFEISIDTLPSITMEARKRETASFEVTKVRTSEAGKSCLPSNKTVYVTVIKQ